MKIIDARVKLRTEQILKPWTTDLKPYYEDCIRFYKIKSRLSVMPVDKLIEEAFQCGIEKMLIYGNGPEDNGHIIELSQKNKMTIPVCSVNLKNGVNAALKEIKKRIEQGAAAIDVSTYMDKINISDRKLYPIYGFCEFYKIPVIIHGSTHFWRGSYMHHCQPQYIDEVAVDFPGLKIIVSHGGSGFGSMILPVVQRHPNVYIEFSALRPSFINPELLSAVNTYLKRKCIFGTGYPLMEFELAIIKWKKILRPEVQELFFSENIQDALYRGYEK